jgi:hypothetical protein
MGVEEKISHRADDTQAQITRLREQVERLVKEYGPTVSHMANRTGAALSDATGLASTQARAMMKNVTPNQIGLMVVAAGLGWMIGRMSR